MGDCLAGGLTDAADVPKTFQTLGVSDLQNVHRSEEMM